MCLHYSKHGILINFAYVKSELSGKIYPFLVISGEIDIQVTQGSGNDQSWLWYHFQLTASGEMDVPRDGQKLVDFGA